MVKRLDDPILKYYSPTHIYSLYIYIYEEERERRKKKKKKKKGVERGWGRDGDI